MSPWLQSVRAATPTRQNGSTHRLSHPTSALGSPEPACADGCTFCEIPVGMDGTACHREILDGCNDDGFTKYIYIYIYIVNTMQIA